MKKFEEVIAKRDIEGTVERIKVTFVHLNGACTNVEFVMGGTKALERLLLQVIRIYQNRKYGYISFIVRNSSNEVIFISKDVKSFNADVLAYKESYVKERSYVVFRSYSVYNEQLKIIKRLLNNR